MSKLYRPVGAATLVEVPPTMSKTIKNIAIFEDGSLAIQWHAPIRATLACAMPDGTTSPITPESVNLYNGGDGLGSVAYLKVSAQRISDEDLNVDHPLKCAKHPERTARYYIEHDVNACEECAEEFGNDDDAA